VIAPILKAVAPAAAALEEEEEGEEDLAARNAIAAAKWATLRVRAPRRLVVAAAVAADTAVVEGEAMAVSEVAEVAVRRLVTRAVG